MRALDERELSLVSGSSWKVGWDFGIFEGEVSGDESIQDVVGAVADVASSAYGTAVEATTDMFEWIANGWAFSADCGRP